MWWLLAAGVGIWCAVWAGVGWEWGWLAFGLALCFGVVGLVLPGSRRWSALVAIACLAAGHTAGALDPRSAGGVRALVPADGAPVLLRVDGRVVEPVVVGPRRGGMLGSAARWNPVVTRTVLALRGVETEAGVVPGAGARVWLRIDGDAGGLRVGDRVVGPAWVRGLAGPGNPGEEDVRLYAHPRGIVGSASIGSVGAMEVEAGRAGLGGVLWAARGEAMGVLGSLGEGGVGGDGGSRALLAAVLLGDRGDAGYEALREPFARTGLGHLLAISGLHVGIACGLVAVGVRLTGARPRVEAVAVILAALALCFLIPARPPVIRASTIVMMIAVARLLGRRYDTMALLALAALGLLAWRPTDLLMPGFQLTFVVTGALVLFAAPVGRRFSGWVEGCASGVGGWAGAAGWWLGRPVCGAVTVAVVAWLASAPLTAVHFGQVPLLSVPMSLVTMPVLALAIGLGYPALLLGAAGLEPVAGPLVSGALGVAGALVGLVEAADSVKGAEVRLAAFPAWLGVLWAAVLFWLGVRASRTRWERVRRSAARGGRLRGWSWGLGGPWAAVAVVAVVTAAQVWGVGRLAPGEALRFHALSVGDGNTYLVRSGGEAMLIDAGSSYLAAGERLIPGAVRALGVRTVERAIVTHADLDHFAALPDAAREIGLREVITTPQVIAAAVEREGSAEAMLFELLAREGVVVRSVSAGDVVEIGGSVARVLHPPAGADFERDNEASMVLVIAAAGGGSVLLTGDAEGAALEAIGSHGFGDGALVADAPHHGSADAGAVSVLTALGPSVVVQSTGPRRVGNEAWARLRGRTRWLTTAVDGAVTVRLMRDGTVEASGYRGER